MKIALILALIAGGAMRIQAAPPAFQWPEGKRVAVSFSFDDARASQMDNGVALFDRHGVKVTFYVNPKNMEPRLEAWKKAAAKGYEIGNHSRSHPCSGNFPWSRENAVEDFTEARMAAEMDGATADIERMLGVKPVNYAYPCGQKFIGKGADAKSTVPMVAKRFRTGRGFRDEAANDPMFCDMAQLLGIQSDAMSSEEMKSVVATAAAQGGWVVFAGHEIGTKGNQTTEVAALEEFLKYAKDPAAGIWLDTVDAIARYIAARR